MKLKNLKSVPTKNMSNDDWLELRKSSIGGSDAGAILGVNNYESPYSLYWKKVEGGLEPEDISDKPQILFGNYMEPFVADMFEKETGKKVRNHNYMMYHPDHDFISANVDRVVIGENALLECKTASEFKRSEWKDGNVPASYMAQCYHYMAVTGAERVYIAVWFGNSGFHWDVIEYDQEIIDDIVQAEVDFWNNHVLAKVQPEADGSEATKETLSRLWLDNTKDNVIEIDNEKSVYFQAIKSIEDQTKELATQKDEYINKLKKLLGENEEGISDTHKITWKQQSTKRIDTKRLKKEKPELFEEYSKETKSRRFSIKELNN